MGIKDETLIKKMCEKITPAQRQFCVVNFGTSDFPEEWLRGARIDPRCLPFTEAQWWEILHERLPTETTRAN